jgi:hypothetical protein
MTSPLHISTTSPSRSAKSTIESSPIVASPFKLATKKMSVTQAYFLAHKARAKLSSEAARPDHNLRLLVGHANLLDSLMLDLAEAEREQESWFNQSVRGAAPKSEEKHIQWADSIVEESEHDFDDSDSSDDDSDFSDDEDVEMADIISLRRIPSHTVKDYGYDMDEDEEDFSQLALQRSPSHSVSPPELDHDSDTSEDESMPPSPPTVVLPTFSVKQADSYYAPTQEDKDAFYDDGYYLPPRNPARLVSAISVY